MPPRHRTGVLTLLLVAVAASSWAQRAAPPVPAATDWSHGSTVAVSGGLASGSSHSGAMLGGAIGWELTPRVMVEGSGLWLERGDADGFNAALKVRAGLRGSGVSPFVEAGFGLYHVTAAAPERMPEFYRRRMTGSQMSSRAFTDPVFQMGAGVNLFTSRHVAFQPAAEVLFVTRGSHAHTLGAVSLRVIYHFEDHPVTLSR